MRNTKMLLTIFIVLIVSSTIFAQVEKTVKETKVKIEKVEKKAMEAKQMGKSTMDGKKCGTEACCSTEAKEMKADMKKGEKMMKKAHAKDCDCEVCKIAHAEMKKQKAHGEDCTCEGCKKS